MKLIAFNRAIRPFAGWLPPKLLKVMKLTAILLMITFMQVSAKVFSQSISLNEKNASLEKVLKSIKKQSGYLVFYQDQEMQKAIPVTIQEKNISIQKALEACFKDQPLTYSIIDKTIVVQKKNIQLAVAPQLNVIVKGHVNDENGQPLPGVTVRLKGSQISAATDTKGMYSLSVPEASGSLVFSFIGYQTTEVDISGRTDINVQLKVQSTGLNETIIVAYGTQKKIDLTGAVDQISGKELQNRPVANVGDALQGMMANLNITTNTGGGAPGAAKTINVRGFTGYDGSLASPLILVDGVETDINSINANDIESVSLLKDAASAALYGSRAPNGVLLITTKQGKKNQAPRLSYSDNFSFSRPLNEPVMSNSLVFANTINEAYVNAGLSPYFTQGTMSRIAAYIQNPKGTPTTIQPAGSSNWASYDDGDNGANSNNDWFKIYLRQWSPSQQHNLSVDGGSDKITYYVGFGTEDQNGLFNYNYDYYKRYNLRANLTADINKYITFSLKTSYSQENNESPYNGGANTGYNFFHQIARTWPNIALIDPNGGYDSYSYIPQLTQGGKNTSRTNTSRINADVTIKPITGWNITGHYSYDYNSYSTLNSVLPYYYSTPANPQTLSSTISSVGENYGLTSYYNYNVFTSYEKKMGGHYFRVMIGEQTEQKTYSDLTGFNQNLYYVGQPSLALTYGAKPFTSDANNNYYSTNNDPYSWATNSTIARVNYNYKDKYLLEGNASYMGTSLFPQDTRYHWFTSVSGGWNISKEDFFEPLRSKINNLKLRASYGGLGDISSFLTKYNYYPSLSNLSTSLPTSGQWLFTPGSDSRQPFVANPGNLVSPTLTWAKPSMLDIGIDVDFLEDFSLTADWYNKKITDQFGPSSTPPAIIGIGAPTVNNAASTTKGWDLTASWKHKFGDLNFSARANIGHYSGTVTQYSGNPTKLINQPYVGEPIGAIWGLKTVGKFQSQAQINAAPSQLAVSGATYQPGDIQYADLNHDGKITYGSNTANDPGDQTIIGNTTPKYFYGFNAAAQWKGIDLAVFLQGQGPADYWPGNNYFWGITSLYQSTVTPKLEDRWTPTNPNGYFPRIDINNGASKNFVKQSGYLLNTAYMRVKNIQFGYTFPNRLTEKIHVYQLRVYGSIDNAFTVSGVFKHQYVDPELLQSDEKIYPLQQTYSFGVQLNIK